MEQTLLHALKEKGNVKFHTLEEALYKYSRNEIFEIWLNHEGLGGDTIEFLKAMVNKDASVLFNMINKEDTTTLSTYYNLSEVMKKNTRYDYYIMWLEYEGVCSYEHEIIEAIELLGLSKKEDLYRRIS